MSTPFGHGTVAEANRRRKALALAAQLTGLPAVPPDGPERRRLERTARVRPCSPLTWRLAWTLRSPPWLDCWG